MKTIITLVAVAFIVLSIIPPDATGQGRPGSFWARLDGFQENPSVSTDGRGSFRGRLSQDGTLLDFELSYEDLEGTTTAAHIHFGRPGVKGGVIALLCGAGSTQNPVCPQSGAVTGTVAAGDVIGPGGQGIESGEFDELVRAMRAGSTYVNVHSSPFEDGEIRGEVAVSRHVNRGRGNN